MSDLIFFDAKDFVAPDQIEGEIFRHLRDPRRRIFRDSVIGPDLQRPRQRFLHHVFGPIQVFEAENPRQRRDHLSRLVTKKMLHHLSNFPGWWSCAGNFGMRHSLSELKAYALARAGCAATFSLGRSASGHSGATGLTSTVAP